MYEKAKAETYIFFLGILSLFICILTFAGYHDYMMHGKPLNINKLLYEKKNDLDSNEFVGQYASITLNSSAILTSLAPLTSTSISVVLNSPVMFVSLADTLFIIKSKNSKLKMTINFLFMN